MVVKSLGREWDINPISWKERQKLTTLTAKTFNNSKINSDGEVANLNIDWDNYYERIFYVLSIAFDNVEAELGELNDREISELGLTIANRYSGVEKKENGGSD